MRRPSQNVSHFILRHTMFAIDFLNDLFEPDDTRKLQSRAPLRQKVVSFYRGSSRTPWWTEYNVNHVFAKHREQLQRFDISGILETWKFRQHP